MNLEHILYSAATRRDLEMIRATFELVPQFIDDKTLMEGVLCNFIDSRCLEGINLLFDLGLTSDCIIIEHGSLSNRYPTRPITFDWRPTPSSSLQHASYADNAEYFTTIVFRGGLVNTPIGALGQRTPLEIAARAGNHEAVEALVNAGADLEATNWHGQTPFSATCVGAIRGHPHFVPQLVEKGANVNVIDSKTGDTIVDTIIRVAAHAKDRNRVPKTDLSLQIFLVDRNVMSNLVNLCLALVDAGAGDRATTADGTQTARQVLEQLKQALN